MPHTRFYRKLDYISTPVLGVKCKKNVYFKVRMSYTYVKTNTKQEVLMTCIHDVS